MKDIIHRSPIFSLHFAHKFATLKVFSFKSDSFVVKPVPKKSAIV